MIYAALPYKATDVSIHAPAWGATLGTPADPLRLDTCQSTRPRRARPLMLAERVFEIDVSIHAPA